MRAGAAAAGCIAALLAAIGGLLDETGRLAA